MAAISDVGAHFRHRHVVPVPIFFTPHLRIPHDGHEEQNEEEETGEGPRTFSRPLTAMQHQSASVSNTIIMIKYGTSIRIIALVLFLSRQTRNGSVTLSEFNQASGAAVLGWNVAQIALNNRHVQLLLLPTGHNIGLSCNTNR